MMKGLYDISKCVFLRVFKKFLKVVRVGKKWSEGVKNGVKWGKKSVPKSAFIHYYCHLQNSFNFEESKICRLVMG